MSRFPASTQAAVAATALALVWAIASGPLPAQADPGPTVIVPVEEELETATRITASLDWLTWIQRDRLAANRTARVIPTLGVLGLRAYDLGTPGLSLNVNGYLAENLGDPGLRPVHGGDLILGSLAWRAPSGDFDLRAGRQLVFSGALLPSHLDGLQLRVRPHPWMSLEAYGGRQVTEAFEADPEGWVVGAGAAFTRHDWGRLGVAFEHRRSEGELAAQVLAGDLALRFFRPLQATADLAYELETGEVEDARIHVIAQPHSWVLLDAFTQLANPAARLPLHSIYRAFVAGLDQSVGLGVDLLPPGALTGALRYEHFLPEAGDGGYAIRGTLRWQLDPAGQYRFGLDVGRLEAPTNGHVSIRGWARVRWLSWLRTSVSTDHYLYDEGFHGYDRSHLADFTLRVLPTPGFELGVDLQAWINPDFEQQGLAMLRLRVTDEVAR